jgi:hypothetical protein
MEITDKERKFIRHALGLTAKKQGYRNRFFAAGDDVATGKSLVAKALAVHLPSQDVNDNDLFVITTRGFNMVKERGETMDREETLDMQRFDKMAFVGA